MSNVNVKIYLQDIVEKLKHQYPYNHIVNIICHGHSVPAGYFATPVVDTFNAYPYLLHKELKERFPFAVINVIVTAIGGENSISGAARFEQDVLCHKPLVITIDYGLNDRNIKLIEAKESWKSMIEKSLEQKIKVLLLTPTLDISYLTDFSIDQLNSLQQHASQIRDLADKYQIGLVDSFAAFEKYVHTSGDITDLLSWVNHPNRKGHMIVATEILRWFSYTSYDNI